jgi:hypothetical protein
MSELAMPIPENCPGCNRVMFLGYLDRPAPRWQPKARLLFLIGAFISGPLLLAAPFIAMLIMAEADPQAKFNKGDRGSVGTVAWAAIGVLALLPSFILGALAFRMPRMLKLDCKDCGWAETIYLPRVRYGRHARPNSAHLE